MTAQVFRNGQQPTFYVSDAISPGSGGLDGTFAHLTVTREENIIVNTATGTYPPLNIISTGATSPAIGMQLLDTVSGSSGSFGLNTAEANHAVFMAGSLGVGAKILTDNIERIRIPASGISVDPLSTESLALANGSTTVICRYPSGAGTFTPTWVSFGGFSVDPTQLIIHYIRAGNQVMCTFFGNAADLTGAAISAVITVPFPSAGLVGSINVASGAGSVQGNGVGFVIFGNSGANNRVSLSATVAAAPAAGSAISGSFMYTIS